MQETAQQREAITATDPRIFVGAAAGSGKTRVTTARIARLINEGIEPNRIMATTFTRKAASEMRARVAALLESRENAAEIVRDLTLGTIHSICLRILKTYGDRIGYGDASRITIVDDDDTDQLLERICFDFHYLVVYSQNPRKIRWREGLSRKKVDQYMLDWYTGAKSKEPARIQEKLHRIVREFHTQMREAYALDFGSILLETNRLLRENPDVLERYREQYQYIFIDEAQDLDKVLHEFIFLLMDRANVFAVGDPRQSIYGFKNARPDILADLVNNHGFRVMSLPHCFRCGDAIVEAANTLIAINNEPFSEPAIGATGADGEINTFCGRSESIVQKVRDICDLEAAPWTSIAVLARKHSHLKRIQFRFQEAGIPSHRSVNTDFKADPNFRLLLAVMRLAINPADIFAFIRLCNAYGVSAVEYPIIRARAKHGGLPILEEYVTNPEYTTGFKNETDREKTSFTDLIEAGWGTESRPCIDAMDFIDRAAEALSVKFSVFAVAQAAFWRSFYELEEFTYLFEALDFINDFDPERGDDYRAGNSVTLSTIHAAKGLEWDYVILAEMNEGTLPANKADESIEESRRIAYVGVTRGRRRVHLHFRGTDDFGEHAIVMPPSRFLTESKLF